MAALRRSRLSRRRPPPGAGPPSARPGSLPDGDGDGECERLWAELLRTVSADLNLDGELPPLPAFSGQEPRSSPERAASPEVFTVGPETFSWEPFPPAPGGSESPGRSYRVFRGAGVRPGSPTESWQGCITPEPCGIPCTQEQPVADGAQTLRSCPMCQADFRPGLAQVDIDSHLAQCLADSTEDVAW
ncbi:Fanconi anemia core complex-associated protein 20 isoform 1-T1 [Hipposideros larvatus]